MLPALVCLKNLIKNKSYHIDLPFFRLHYQFTVCILLAYCLILTAKVLFGDTIDCDGSKGRNEFYDNMCYATGTYTKFAAAKHIKPAERTTTTQALPDILATTTSQSNAVVTTEKSLNTQQTSSDLLNGIGASAQFYADNSSRYMHYSGILLEDREYDKDQIKVFWHTYYQYIPIMLFLQALLFYLPHYLWKVWENGMISSICQRLYENRFAPGEHFESNSDIVHYTQNLFRLNKSLVYRYYICHVLCLVNLVVQVISLNMIFNYQFVTYGWTVFKYLFVNENVYGLKSALTETAIKLQQHNLNNPMDFVFPKVTICRVVTGSQAGKTPDESDFLCVLPLNILNDKFFLGLWGWFLTLIVLTAWQIIYDVAYIMLPYVRKELFARRYGMSLYDSENRHKSSLPELFLLDLIGQNTDKFAFSALLKKLNKDDWTATGSDECV